VAILGLGTLQLGSVSSQVIGGNRSLLLLGSGIDSDNTSISTWAVGGHNLVGPVQIAKGAPDPFGPDPYGFPVSLRIPSAGGGSIYIGDSANVSSTLNGLGLGMTQNG